MNEQHVKLRPANQSLIINTYNEYLCEILKVTQSNGIKSNEIDNLFRCKKVYKFPDGDTVYIPKLVPKNMNLYGFIADILITVKNKDIHTRKYMEKVISKDLLDLLQKALLLNFDDSNSEVYSRLFANFLSIQQLNTYLAIKDIS